jgi:hypothetical protein
VIFRQLMLGEPQMIQPAIPADGRLFLSVQGELPPLAGMFFVFFPPPPAKLYCIVIGNTLRGFAAVFGRAAELNCTPPGQKLIFI